MMLPADLHRWPRDQQMQWIADELWLHATSDETPAPAAFVAVVNEVVTWAKQPRMDGT